MFHNHTLFAAILAVLASIIVSLTDNFVGAVKETAGLWQFQLLKAAISVPLLAVAAKWAGVRLRPYNVGRVLLRSLAVALGLLIYFAALGVLPVAQAGAGLYSAPIWIMLFSVLFLGKAVGWRRIVAMLVGFAGVLALLQPDLSDLAITSALPLLAGAFYGAGGLATGQLCADEHPIVLAIGVFATIGVIAAVLLVWFTLYPVSGAALAFHTRGWEPVTARFLWLTLGQALGAASAIAILANAYRFGEADFVSVCEYSFLVFAALWAFVLWGLPTNALAQIGMGTIILSGFCMYLLDRRAAERAQLAAS